MAARSGAPNATERCHRSQPHVRFQGPGLVAIVRLAGCDWPIDLRRDIVYLVPEDFRGWMSVDFDVRTAPPLPRTTTQPRCPAP